MRFRHAPVLLVLLAIGALPGYAQLRTGSRQTFEIQGYVRDDSNQQPMENVKVDLRQSAGSPMATTFTHGNGEFEFTNLGSGTYTIEVVVPGYDTYSESVTVFNSSVRGMGIFMTQPVTFASSTGGATISAHQLSAPHKARDEYDKGMFLMYRKSDYPGAIAQFERAIRDFPTYYEAYAQLGSAYLFLVQIAPAEAAFRKSVELSSGNFSQALFGLSGLLSVTKRPSEAEPFAREGIAVDPSSWRGPYELALALSGLKRMDEAEKSALQARDLKPDNPSIYLLLANIHMQQSNPQALSKDLDAYIKLVPTGPVSDQARKDRDQIQARLQELDKQTRSAAKEDAHSDSQHSTTASAAASSPGQASTPALEEDTSGLPSLPPPTQSAQ